MAKSKGPIPEGFHTVTPYLVMSGVAGLMEFLKQAFDAQELERMARPDGSIAHAAMRIGDSMVEMGEAPGEGRAMPAALHLYVRISDETYQRALQAGAISLYEPRTWTTATAKAALPTRVAISGISRRTRLGSTLLRRGCAV
jgi:uncharacterized glyoxalase superfamily protein PhnB